jgi:ribosomal protein L29
MKKHEPESALRNLSDKIELQKQVADSKKELLTTQRKYI